MVLELKTVETPSDKNKFVRLPWKIYQDYPFWVPPLISERERFLDPQTNPFFKHAEVDLFLALSENGIPVGRIALILDHTYNEFHSERVGCFGFFESVNDRTVADLLLDKAYTWCREKGLDKLQGPFNMSTNHECGLLVEGFDMPPVVGIPYNPPYYQEFFEHWGLTKAMNLVSLKMDFIKIPEYLERAVSRIGKRNRFTIRPIRLNSFDEEVEAMWDIYNSAWSRNWGFAPMPREEFIFAVNEVKQIIQPELCLIAEVGGEPAGFSLVVLDVNQVLKSMDGRLFPFGWAKFLWNKRNINTIRVVAVGVKKKYRRLGIDAVLYHEIYKQCLSRKILRCDMSWVLEGNRDILDPIHRIGGTVYKRHRIYERACNT